MDLRMQTEVVSRSRNRVEERRFRYEPDHEAYDAELAAMATSFS